MYRILRHKASATAAGVTLLLLAAWLSPVGAVTYLPSQTIKAGTKIACVLDETINSSTAKYGDVFKLRVLDQSHPILESAEIVGYVTDVTKPGGANRARIGFFLTSIHLRNGSKKPISAYVVNRRVVQYNPAGQQAVRQQLPPAGPYGTVTPGPIAWQMRIDGGGKPSISNRPSGLLGGYIYAAHANEPIVIRAGVSVTVELQNDLTIP